MSLKIWLYVALYKLSICLGCESWMLWSLWWSLYTNKWLCNLKCRKNVLMYNYIYYNTNVSVLWVVICPVYWTWCNVWAVSTLFTTLSKEKRDSHTTSGMMVTLRTFWPNVSIAYWFVNSGGAFIKMYSVFCTVEFGSVNNGETRMLTAFGLEKWWRAAVLPQREGGRGG